MTQAIKDNHYAVVRMKNLRAWGVAPPELPAGDLPPNPLDTWKIVTPPTKPSAHIFKVQQEKNVVVQDKKGARLTVDYEIRDAGGQPCSIELRVLDAKENKSIKDKRGRILGVIETVKPESDRPGPRTVVLFFPYERMTELLAEGETKDYKFVVDIRSSVFQEFVADKPWTHSFKLGR